MRIVNASEVDAVLGYADLIEALRDAFRRHTTVPLRHHHTIPTAGREATLLLMPAWSAPGPAPAHVGVKVVTVYPDNDARNQPSVMGTYLLLDGSTGAPVASIDGPALTARRTAAASHLRRQNPNQRIHADPAERVQRDGKPFATASLARSP